MKKFTFLLALAVLVGLSSCSKEKKMEKRLADSTWKIDRIEWVKTAAGLGGIGVQEGTETNAGNFVFGASDGTSTITIDGVTEVEDFTWAVGNNGEEISMDYDVTIQGTTTDVRLFVVEQTGKKTQEWFLTEVHQDLTGQYTLTATFYLSK